MRGLLLEAVLAEALLVLVAIVWCGSTSGVAPHLASLMACSLANAVSFLEPTDDCRRKASTGLVLGTLVLPTLFAVQSSQVDALYVAFRLTWWCGLVSNAMRSWMCYLRPRCTAEVSRALGAVAVLLICGGISAAGDAWLLPALSIFLACWVSIQSAVPRSFTLGEAVVVAELCAVLLHVIMFSVILQVAPLHVLTSKLRKIIAIGLSSAVGISAGNLLLFRALGGSGSASGSRGVGSERCRAALHLALTLLSVALMLEWMSLSIGENSLSWFSDYVTGHTATPLKFILFYLAVLIPALAFAPGSQQGSRRQVLVRKYFHVLALILFVPTILINIRFMALAFAVAIAVFMVVESLRIAKMPVIASVLDSFMQSYVDDRDEGVAVLTHIYLLLGCALPVFFTYFVLRGIFSANALLIALSGVTVTGLGDAMASFCGVHFGRHRWRGSKKTVEGTLAMIAAVLAFQAVCLCAVGFHNLATASWCKLVLADIFVALLEAKTDQIDNLFLPLYHMALLQMV